MMTCRELIGFLMEFVSGELPEDQREEFEMHLAACPPCVAYIKTYREAARLGKGAFCDPAGEGPGEVPDGVPGEVPEDLLHAILAARRRSH